MKQLLLHLIIFIFMFIFSLSINAKKVTIVEWKALTTLNVDTGDMSKELKKNMKKNVSISGFIIPLDNDGMIDTITEFMLIPQPLACYHVPLPPANQMIYVRMKKPIPIDIDMTGVEIHGEISLIKDVFDDGDSLYSFQINGYLAKEADLDFEMQFVDDDLPMFQFPIDY